MKHLSKIALLALSCGLLVVALLSTHSPAVKAQSITNGTTSNTQVTLFCTGYNSYTCSTWQVYSASGVQAFPLVPAGQTLIITDMECSMGEKSGEYGHCVIAQVTVPPVSTVAEAAAIADPNGVSVVGLHLTTGIPFTAIPLVYSSGPPLAITIQGYLIPTPSVSAGS
jgi:hypothetical protein